MDDPELAALRAKRMAEMQAQAGRGQPGGRSNEQAEAAQRQQEMKDAMLSALLTQDARARQMSNVNEARRTAVGRIAAVKPDKARQVEELVIRLTQQGQLQPKVDEQQLIALLDRVSEATSKPTVKINRRRVADSDEDDDWS